MEILFGAIPESLLIEMKNVVVKKKKNVIATHQPEQFAYRDRVKKHEASLGKAIKKIWK